MGRDTHAASEPAERSALEVLAANGVETILQAGGGYTATPGISHAILAFNARSFGAARRRHRDHAFAQPAARRRLQIQPAARRPGRHRRHRLGAGPRQRALAREQRRREAPELRSGQAREHHARARFCRRVRGGSRERGRHRGDSRDKAAPGRRSIGRREHRLLVAHRRTLRARHQCREPHGRSALFVHDRRPRRQDPHGLLEPLRDGQARRAEGQIRHRVRQRSGLGPTRHRHAVGGLDESESLPRGRDSLPVHASPAVVAEAPRSAKPWSAAR